MTIDSEEPLVKFATVNLFGVCSKELLGGQIWKNY